MEQQACYQSGLRLLIIVASSSDRGNSWIMFPSAVGDDVIGGHLILTGRPWLGSEERRPFISDVLLDLSLMQPLSGEGFRCPDAQLRLSFAANSMPLRCMRQKHEAIF